MANLEVQKRGESINLGEFKETIVADIEMSKIFKPIDCSWHFYDSIVFQLAPL